MDRGVETLGGSRLAVVGCVCLFFSIPSIKTQVHPRRPARRRRVKSLINPSVKMFKSKFVPSPLLWLPARLAARARWGLFGLAPPGSLAVRGIAFSSGRTRTSDRGARAKQLNDNDDDEQPSRPRVQQGERRQGKVPG